MKNSVSNILIFALGVAVGTVITWRYTKKKYEQLAEEEIQSVKEVFANKKEASRYADAETDISERPSPVREKPDLATYTANWQKHDYTKYYDTQNKTENEEEDNSMSKPYVIDPEDFGELDDYEKISLTYYADQVIADDNDDLMEDVENTIGFDSLTHFGEYEEDAVFVQNDRLKCYYEILLDQRTFSSLMNKKPHIV